MQKISDIVRAKFPFEVNKFPLSGPDNMPTPHYGLFRSDNSECVGKAVSSIYHPHTVEDIAVLCDACQEVFPEFSDVQTYWRDGHYVFVTPSFDYRRQLAIEGANIADVIFPTLGISGGFDGKPFRGSLLLQRPICTNMMILETVGGTQMTIRHTPNMKERMKELVLIFEKLSTRWENVTTIAQQMADRRVVLADFLAAVYPEAPTSKKGETQHKAMIEAIVERIQRENQQMGISTIREVSAWSAFNGVQGYIQHQTRPKQSAMNKAILSLGNETIARAERVALGLSV